jgi:hypothetical protein
LYVRVGNGGAGDTNESYNGGTGSAGYVRIRGGADGDRTFVNNSNARGNSDHNYRAY